MHSLTVYAVSGIDHAAKLFGTKVSSCRRACTITLIIRVGNKQIKFAWFVLIVTPIGLALAQFGEFDLFDLLLANFVQSKN